MDIQPLAGIKVVFIINMLVGIGLAQNNQVFQGTNAEPKVFPYMAMVEYRTRLGEAGYCDGSLVSNSVIVTAAHCIDSAIRIVIQLGIVDFDNSKEEGSLTIGAQNWLTHPNYTRGALFNDIGWIILTLHVEFTDYVKPVKMTFEDQTANREAILSSFGRDNRDVPTNLQWVSMSTTNTSCFKYFNIPDTENNRCAMFCAIGQGRSSPCNSDVGGPLVTFEDNTQIGLIALQKDYRCHLGGPVVFTKIAHHYRWIKASVEEFNKNKSNSQKAGSIP